MNKKIQTILNVLVIVFAVISITTNVFAAVQPNDFKEGTDPTGTFVTDTGKQIVGILQTIGIIVSVVVLIVLGIKYMMGSAEEKAEYKKTFIPYIVGAILIFAASFLAQGLYDVINGWKTNTGNAGNTGNTVQYLQ